MTDAELDEIEKACAEATPGPWYWEADELLSPWTEWVRAVFHGRANGEPTDADWSRLEEIKRAQGEHHAGEPIVETDGGQYGPCPKDRFFVANSRQWIPALVAEVRRLRAEKTSTAPQPQR